MSLLKDFRQFAMRGNVVDLAVGVVIGAAFGKIVASFVENIIMPPLNLLTAKYGVNFDELALKVQTDAPLKNEDGSFKMAADGSFELANQAYAILKYGPFIQTIVDFLLVAAAIFLAVKLMNKAKDKFEKEKPPVTPAPPSEEVLLLREIRDSLAKRG